MNTFDIETEDWDKFVCGAIHDERGTRIFWDERKFLLELLAREGTYWAHNGGRFDFLWVLDAIARFFPDSELILTVSGGSVISAHPTGTKLFLKDSYRLMPIPLSKIGEYIGRPKLETGLRCRCGEDCGGYCSIRRRGMTRAERRKLEEYLRTDVEVLAEGLDRWCCELMSLGVPATKVSTIGGAAWKSASAMLDLPNAKWTRMAYLFARGGYYGGRCEVGRLFAPRIERYDRVSAYPHAMTLELPIGEIDLSTDISPAGIYRAEVYVPESPLPPLPVRLSERVVYPHGIFSGIWTGLELIYAESRGVKIRRVMEGMVWREYSPILRPWIGKIWARRARAIARGNKAESTLFKLLANSLSGRFALSPQMDIVKFSPVQPDDDWAPVGRSDFVWAKRGGRIDYGGSRHVQMAAVITARARIALHHAIMDVGPDSWIYSDTDSVISTKGMARGVGEDLGAWKYEGEGYYWRAVAPKVYSYETSARPIYRAKGVCVNSKDAWDAYISGAGVTDKRGVRGIRSTAEKIFERRILARAFRGCGEWVGGRLRDGDKTRAPSIDEVTQKFS